jgi:lysophospholipase L1-like esterase
MERTSSPDLRLVKLGCPGETTITMLAGGAHCHYRSGSELSAALAFLHRHPSTVLVTLDLGFNNVRACMAHHVVNQPCVSEALAVVKLQLTSILTQLRSAAPPGMRIIGVGHYDPYLGDYLKGAAGRTFASQSLDVITRLNDALRSTYAAAGVPMADVGAAFDSSDTDPTTLAGVGTVPEDVARTCALTWMCTPAPLGPNPHPNDAGYHAIAEAISQVIVAEGPLH